MATVGYGDVYAVSFLGRMVSIVNALFGAFLISSLVAVIGQVFNLSENQKNAIADITNNKSAAKSVNLAIKYKLARRRYYHYQAHPE